MSQSSGVKSPQSLQFELKPELKAVLGCLDVQLEQELTRYRRYRRRAKQTSTDETESSKQTLEKVPDVVTVASDEQAASQGKLFEPKSTASGWETVVPGEPAPLAVAARVSNGSAPKPNGEPPVSFTLTSPSKGSTPSEGYLESTEALIKSIEERRSFNPQQRSLLASLLTPVGILSMLLFLLSCAALSTVIFSTSGRTSLGLDRFFPGNSQTAQTNNPPTPAVPAKTETVPPLESQSPNLAAKEFVQLDLDSLSHINPSPTPLPTPTTANPVPPAPSTTVPSPSNTVPSPNDPGMNNLSRELLPQPKPTIPAPATTVPVSPAPAPTLQPGGGSTAATTPTTSATVTAPKKATTPIQSQDGYYYVVVDYKDERSFEQAREVVPDAYVADFKTGKKIQLGALGNLNDAKRLVEELQVQGIVAHYDIPTQNQ